EPLRREVEGGVPADFLAVGSPTAKGAPQPVRILVQILQGHCLRADVALAEDVLVVATNGEDPLAVDLNGQAAHCLAQRAGPEVRMGSHEFASYLQSQGGYSR